MQRIYLVTAGQGHAVAVQAEGRRGQRGRPAHATGRRQERPDQGRPRRPAGPRARPADPGGELLATPLGRRDGLLPPPQRQGRGPDAPDVRPRRPEGDRPAATSPATTSAPTSKKMIVTAQGEPKYGIIDLPKGTVKSTSR